MDRIEDPLDRSSQAAFSIWDAPLPRGVPASMVHVQSLEEKRSIFSRMNATMSAERERGEAILSRLRTLSPQIAELFELKDDQVDDFTMRLINNRPDEAMPEESYVAISYCWPQQPQPYLTIPMSAALFQAAMAERAASNEGLWIDQMCIDQTSNEEKSISIPFMAALYRNASRIVVCLDDVEMDEDEMLFLGRDVLPEYGDPALPPGQFPHLNDPIPYMTSNPVLYRFFGKVCESRWFTRAWCSHEMRLAQWHRFYIKCPTISPDKVMAFGFTGQFLWWLAALSSSLPALSGAMSKARTTITQTLDIRQRIRQTIRLHRGDYASESNDNTYTIAMLEAFELGAGGNPGLATEDLRNRDANRDRMSIVLNLLGNGLRLKRTSDPLLEDYNSVDKCFRTLMALAIAAGDPVALCTTGESLKAADDSPSWLSRPKVSDLGSAPDAEKLPEMSTVGIKMDPSPLNYWVQLDGYLLSTSNTPTTDSAAVITARLVVTVAKRLDMGLSPTGEVDDVFGVGPDYSVWQYQTTTPEGLECFIQTLACVLYCGHDWMERTARRCSFPSRYLESLISNAAIHRDGLNFHALMQRPSFEHDEPGWKGVSAILRFTNWLMAWGHNTTHGARENWTPYLFAVGENTILTFAKAYDGGPYIFFLKCLANDAYVRLARAWVLEPVSVGENHLLVLRGKTRIFSPVSLEDLDDSGWVFVRDKMIYVW